LPVAEVGGHTPEQLLARANTNVRMKAVGLQPPACVQVVEGAVELVHEPPTTNRAEARQQNLRRRLLVDQSGLALSVMEEPASGTDVEAVNWAYDLTHLTTADGSAPVGLCHRSR
jgi:hypothetical protein